MPIPVPPVPHVSINLGVSVITLADRFRIACAAPKTSSTVSPFIERAIKKAPICASVDPPFKISDIIADISDCVRLLFEETLLIPSCIFII